MPVAIVDANNINVEVLGTSPGFPLDAKSVREVLLDNPLGQNDELHADHHRATRAGFVRSGASPSSGTVRE